MNLRLIVTILVIAAAPVCAQAQKPTPAKVTKADAPPIGHRAWQFGNNLGLASAEYQDRSLSAAGL